ncbi:MAG: zinc ribbon domain-containing protein [Eubacterium sp.]|nr:zinc ribbon domain-containing protein [Eubacterium sp.]MCM1217869.1 zinc ribbon domain-containing protein [Lachnospiraceae bacterium]MCM1305600.1 zinc ribbon domain-containing protein [Butyrivibrio sp.]MCM1345175.1 zinc ribbon domain-containing protein [Muribaculaceae bacterium]MCM1240901.1 zinc ribbon domain-containing protein [Lachnospiraceae bacterium]
MGAGQVGTIVILALALAVMGGGYVAYRNIRDKIRTFTRLAFGSDTIKGSFENMDREAEITPKSVSAATKLYLPQILRDFPEFHYDEMKNRAENVLTGFLSGIDEKNPARLPEGVTSELREKLQLKIGALDNEDAEEHFRNIKIHRTEIRTYRKLKGRCSIIFQSAVQYNHFKKRDGEVTAGAEERLEQGRYNVEMIYIQDRDLVENQADSGLAMNCPNCGAPLPRLGAKKCLYCDTPIEEFNIKIWHFSDVEEA